MFHNLRRLLGLMKCLYCLSLSLTLSHTHPICTYCVQTRKQRAGFALLASQQTIFSKHHPTIMEPQTHTYTQQEGERERDNSRSSRSSSRPASQPASLIIHDACRFTKYILYSTCLLPMYGVHRPKRKPTCLPVDELAGQVTPSFCPEDRSQIRPDSVPYR